jgi:hypothetical protein
MVRVESTITRGAAMRVRRLPPVTAVAIAAVALMIGLATPAMAHQARVVAHKISGSDLKPNSVTGKQIKESTLGVVPEARKLTPLRWHRATLIASDNWVNYGSPYYPAEYALDSQGIVHFRGAIKNTSGLAGSVAFLVPKALEPASYVNMPTASDDGVIGEVEINLDNVAIYAPPGGVAQVADYTSLDGVTYSIR